MNFSKYFLSYELKYLCKTIQDTEGIEHLIQFLDVPTSNNNVKTSYPLATMKKQYYSLLKTNK